MQSLLDKIKLILNTENEDDIEKLKEEMRALTYQDKDAYSVNEASERLSISKSSLYNYEKRGKLKITKVEGGAKIIVKEDLLDFLKFLRQGV